MDQIERNIKKRRKILFDKDSFYFSELSDLIDSSSKKELVLWSFHFVQDLLKEISILAPHEQRPNIAYMIVKDWAEGKLKMPDAKKAILECHQVAQSTENQVLIAYVHAVGQGLSVVHTVKHALGLPMYELTGLVHQYPLDYRNQILKKINDYVTLLKETRVDHNEDKTVFAHFIQ